MCLVLFPELEPPLPSPLELAQVDCTEIRRHAAQSTHTVGRQVNIGFLADRVSTYCRAALSMVEALACCCTWLYYRPTVLGPSGRTS